MKNPVDAMTELCPPLAAGELDDCVLRCCIACGHTYTGPLACPLCGEPGEPIPEATPAPATKAPPPPR